ncbi:MAG: hypothetical protein JXR37_15095 [Kiritimatiellae bacterium]|nr:hypothetical protein [Kiritimatiellia bacterium]
MNSAVFFARERSLFATDPLLGQVRKEARPGFLYYGCHNNDRTATGAMEIKDLNRALTGPWFPPAYPLLMSVLAVLGPARWILYVAPLFALFTALVAGAAARMLLEREWAAWVASVSYLLNPIVAWHGRCARPEFMAGFFMLSALVILMHAHDSRGRIWPDVVLGAVCVSIAPFFHVTAWLGAIPAAWIVALLLLRGRTGWLPYPFVALAGLLLFVYQTIRVTDHYRMAGYFEWIMESPIAAVALAAGVLLVLTAVCVAMGRIRRRRPSNVGPGRRRYGLVFSLAVLVLTAGAFLTVYFVSHLPAVGLFRGDSLLQVLKIADLYGFARLLSRPVALLGLIGWGTFVVRGGTMRTRRGAVALGAFPGLILSGVMYEYMYGARYMLIFLCPFLALSMASLATLLPATPGWRKRVPVIVAMALALLGVQNRLHLYRITEYQGFTRFLGSFADQVMRENGILLFEYSRIAAPLRSFFGVPTLALDNERHTDYAAQEEAWAAIMRANPSRPAFFATPFPPPMSHRFRFEPAGEFAYAGRRLRQVPRALPDSVQPWRLNLCLYRMALRTPGRVRPETEFQFPYARMSGAGNMGLSRFANLRVRSPEVAGLALSADAPCLIPIPASAPAGGPCELFLFVLDDTAVAERPELSVRVGDAEWRAGARTHLIADWSVYRLRPECTADRTLEIRASCPGLLTDAQMVWSGGACSLLDAPDASALVRRRPRPFMTRRARQDAELVVPVPGEGKGWLLTFLVAPDAVGETITLDISSRERAQERPFPRPIPTGRWRWDVWPMPASTGWAVSRMRIHSDRVFDPGQPGYPSDLAVMMGYWAVVR